MAGIFEQLNNLSIEDLNLVIAKAQKLIEVKEKEALRLAQLEKERLEKERLEEIAQLQKRLQELQGEAVPPVHNDEQPKIQKNTQENVQAVPVQQKIEPESQVYSWIQCPRCHQMITSDSKFCHFCGNRMEVNAAQANDQSDTQRNVQPENFVEYNSGVMYMDESVKKWQILDGERDMSSWQQVTMTSPEEAKKLVCYMKITTKRILISTESALKAGARNSAFGLIGYLAVEEKGKPWIGIPLDAVRSYRMIDKKGMQIEADQMYNFRSSKAQDIYAALQRLVPDRAR